MDTCGCMTYKRQKNRTPKKEKKEAICATGLSERKIMTGEKSTRDYCVFFSVFFSELLFEVGGHFLPSVLNEPFVYVLSLCKSLSASKSCARPPRNNRGSCQCANMTRIQSEKMFSSPEVMTIASKIYATLTLVGGEFGNLFFFLKKVDCSSLDINNTNTVYCNSYLSLEDIYSIV